jgi:hypothetical protein
MLAQQTEDVLIEALFVSDVQCSQHPSPEAIRDAVEHAVEQHGENGCAALVAQEFGEHPDSAVGRMRWARTAVHDAYPFAR